MFRRLDDPNKDDTACGACAVRRTSNECADVWYLMCDTDTGSEQHYCAVRIEVLTACKSVSGMRSSAATKTYHKVLPRRRWW